jgi:hypothetical protein
MSDKVEKLSQFVEYAGTLKGDEKSEAQVFCDRLFQAFGHAGYKEAGAELEFRVKRKGKAGERDTTSFADLVWPGRVLLEMKKSGAKLQQHFQQAFDYWLHIVPDRPRYMILCNFRELWIYDLSKQIYDPVDRLELQELPKRYTALNFLFPEPSEPIFGNDREAVTREAADGVASVFNSLVKRVDRPVAQRFILQIVFAMFAEDMDLLPSGIVSRIIEDCRLGRGNSYDLFGGLFRQMDTLDPARGGLFRDVPYFNGGLYATVEPLELKTDELLLISQAASMDWSKVNPAIFGTLFQGSMDAEERHAYGAHYTAEADILRAVQPTIVKPWMDRIANAKTGKALQELRKELLEFKVLDPACGSGNFLYVSYREMVRLEISLLLRLRELLTEKEFHKLTPTLSLISPKQFSGIDRDNFGIELAKVTLLLGKKLAIDEAVQALERQQVELELADRAIPLDNLDANFKCADALFIEWPQTDAIVGNPPFQSKNKMQAEFGRAYVNRVRTKFPDISGRADYCVFWFRRAHDHLKPGQRAGLVGTNTIRQTYSRQGGLDYIVNNGGTITEAVSSQVWPGDAVVHVSIVNWIKGQAKGKKRLSRQLGDHVESPWEVQELDEINSALSFGTDVTQAERLETYARVGGCYQGQTHGHKGFLLSRADFLNARRSNPRVDEVLFPFLIGTELIGRPDSLPQRYVIDFGDRGQMEARAYGYVFQRVEQYVLPTRKEAAEEEAKRNKKALEEDAEGKTTHDHEQALEYWWRLFRRRGEMLKAIHGLSRYIVCVRVTKRPIFAFVDPEIHPNDSLMVFPYQDDYSFGILQSRLHWMWFTNQCSTMKREPRYTSNTVFDTYPWPQSPTTGQITEVAHRAKALRDTRWKLMTEHRITLRRLYRTIEEPGKHPLKEAQAELDEAVAAAYGMSSSKEPLAYLLQLNHLLAEMERRGDQPIGPGLPPKFKNHGSVVTTDRLVMPQD